MSARRASYYIGRADAVEIRTIDYSSQYAVRRTRRSVHNLLVLRKEFSVRIAIDVVRCISERHSSPPANVSSPKTDRDVTPTRFRKGRLAS